MRLVFALTLCLALPISTVRAEETRFLCSTEEAMNSIAEKIIIDQEQADIAAKPLLEQQICAYLPEDIHIDITYHGKSFTSDKLKVQVVGFLDGSGQRMFYGMMPLDEGSV